MNLQLKSKGIGFYLVVISGVLGVISLIRFLLWAPNHDGMDLLIVISLVIGILIDIVLIFKDNPFALIGTTLCYSVAAVLLITNSVGSFVDAFQGINMFGDSTQVPTIISISTFMLLSVLFSILASFTKRTK